MRLVIRQVASLQEIDTHFDIVDLWDANEALDIQDEAEWRAAQKGS